MLTQTLRIASRNPCALQPQRRTMYSFVGPNARQVAVLDDGSTVVQRNARSVLPPGSTPSKTYPPAVTVAAGTPKYNVAKVPQDVQDQIVELRRSNPDSNTVDGLARRFNLHPRQVMALVQAPKERIEQVNRTEAEGFARLRSKQKLKLLVRTQKKLVWQ